MPPACVRRNNHGAADDNLASITAQGIGTILQAPFAGFAKNIRKACCGGQSLLCNWYAGFIRVCKSMWLGRLLYAQHGYQIAHAVFYSGKGRHYLGIKLTAHPACDFAAGLVK